LFVSQQPAFPW